MIEKQKGSGKGERGQGGVEESQSLNSEVVLPITYSVRTNFLRELAFVTHHGVHHLAMIKVICLNYGVDLPENFGMAPSTQNNMDLFLMSSKIKR